ncbi:MAG: hypothetical protein LBK76_02510 [Verrucomicrobiales bacterium]|jgi:hypothetical protein|nr:hypothetical protein [Verrucomicrobiales bacterium]
MIAPKQFRARHHVFVAEALTKTQLFALVEHLAAEVADQRRRLDALSRAVGAGSGEAADELAPHRGRERYFPDYR